MRGIALFVEDYAHEQVIVTNLHNIFRGWQE